MTPEEFERIKEQEKAHLREMRRLQGLAADAGRKGRLASALESIAGALTHGDDERGALMDRLGRDAAHTEARLDVALEAEAEASARAAQAAEQARFEQEQQQARARATLDAMRTEMGQAAAGTSASPAAPTPPGAPASPVPAAAAKTLGRTPPPEDAAPAPDGPPAKTLGRS